MNWNGVVSLFIACIELLLLINLISFSEKNRFNITATIIIGLLFLYQLVEFIICMVGLDSSVFVYIGFVIISYLPPLGLILIASLNNVSTRLLYLLFIPAILFTVYYGLVINDFTVTSCSVLYATYNYPLGDLYGAIYYLPIIVTLVWLIKTSRSAADKKIKTISSIILFGYIFTSIPVIIAFILRASKNYYLLSMIESIMCKFALILALCLSFAALYNPGKKNE